MKIIVGIFKFFAYCFLGLIILSVFGAIVGGGSGSSSHTSQSAQNTPVAAVAVPSGGATNSVAQEAPQPVEPEPNWYYQQDKDEMRNSTNFFARTTSKNTVYLDFPYSGGTQLEIILRKSAGTGDAVMLRVDKGQFLCGVYDCEIVAKFDDRAIQTFEASRASGGSGVLFISAYRNFTNNLKKSQRLTLEVYLFNRGSEQFTFDVSGLEWEHFGSAAPKSKRRR